MKMENLFAQLPDVDSDKLKYSSGFLVSKPQKWFPGLSSYWSPLANLLNIDFQVVSINLNVISDPMLEQSWLARLGEKEVYLNFSNQNADYFASLILQKMDQADSFQPLLLDYLARRILKSICISWTGSDLGQYIYQGAVQEVSSLGLYGVAKISLAINNRECELELCLGQELVELLDGLWRRQTRSLNVNDLETKNSLLEIDRIPCTEEQYETVIEPGTELPLTITSLNQAQVYLSDEEIYPVKLFQNNQQFVVQSSPDLDINKKQGLHVCLGEMKIDAHAVYSFGHSGCCVRSNLDLSNELLLLYPKKKPVKAILIQTEQGYAVKVS